MPTVTLADLRARTRSIADVDQDPDGFIQDSKYSLDAWLNAGLRSLYEIVAEFGNDYAKEYVYTGVVAGEEELTLPADFRTLISLEYKDEPIQQYGFTRTGERYACRPRYRIEFGKLRLLPAPSESGPVLRLWYFPSAPTLSLATDSVEVFESGWEDLAIYEAAAKCAVKEERDSSYFQSMRSELSQRIAATAARRSATGSNQVVDVSGWGADMQGSYVRNGWSW